MNGSVMTTSEKIVENTVITALSRLSMVVTPLLLTAAVFFFWMHIQGISADASEAVEKTSRLEIRMSTVESNQQRGREERIKAQDELSRSIDKLTDVITAQGQQIAALTATVEGLKTQLAGKR
jgi:hypothetical protein